MMIVELKNKTEINNMCIFVIETVAGDQMYENLVSWSPPNWCEAEIHNYLLVPSN